MGCCFSKKTEDPAKATARGVKYYSTGSGSRDPPPTESPHEEEKVKEVLSETPKFTIQRPAAAAAAAAAAASARSIDVDSEGAKPRPRPRPKQADNDDDDDDQCPEMRSEVLESSTAASELSTTSATNYSTSADVQEARAEEEDEMALKKTRSLLITAPSPAKVAQNRKKKKKVVVNYNQAAASAARREMRGSVVDVGCRSARSSPSPQRRVIGGNTTASGGATMTKRSDLGERSGRRSVSPSATKNRYAGTNAAAPAMDQRQCRLMSSSSSAAAAASTGRVNNGRYTSPHRIPPTPSRVVDLGESVVGPATARARARARATATARARTREQEDTESENAANGSGGRLLEAPRPLDNHDMEHRKEESLENPLVSLECFIFL